MKTCIGCDQPLALDMFPKNGRGKYGRHSRCKSCRNIQQRQYRASLSPEEKAKARGRIREWRTGVTQEQYAEAFLAQDGCCAICGRHQEEHRQALHADHCHTTGVFRGLLCENCNRGLGMFKDNQALMLIAIDYLSKERWHTAIAS